MKKIINIYNFMLLLALSSMVGCTEESDLGLEIIPTHEEVITESFSIEATVNNEVVDASDAINVGSYITFSDNSVDEISRTWILEDGACFLVDSFDSTSGITDQIDNNKGTTSDLQQESIYFMEPGFSTVTLLSKFSQNVGYEDDNVTAVYYDGNWEVTTIFDIPVFSKDLSPVVRVTSGDKSIEFTMEDLFGDNQELEVGRCDDIVFEDLTQEDGFTNEELDALGALLSREWSYSGGSETFDDPASPYSTIIFNADSDVSYSGFWVNINRVTPIAATTGDILIPLTIKIVDAEIKVLSLELNDLDQIVMTLDKNMNNNISSVEGFSLAVTNNNAEVSGINITSATVDSDDPTKVILALSENIYSDDEITLSFDGSDDIRSANDYASVGQFEATQVTNNIGNVLDAEVFGCEDWVVGTLPSTSGVSWWVSSTFKTNIAYAQDPVNSDNTVLKIIMPEANTTTFTMNSIMSIAPTISAGTYAMRYKLYIDETTGAEMSDCLHQVQYKSASVAYTTACEDTYPTQRNEWVTMSSDVVFDIEMVTLQIKVAFSKTTYTSYPESAIFYFDDMELIPIRPIE